MITRRDTLILLGSLPLNLLFASGNLDSSWESFLGNLDREWEAVRRSQDTIWKEYIEELEREWRAYVKEIKQKWKNRTEIINKRKFVVYTNNNNVKKVMHVKDDKIEIRVEFLRKPHEKLVSRKTLEKHIEQFVQMKGEDVVENIKPIKAVEEKFKEKSIIRPKEHTKIPLASDIITGKKEPSKEEVKEAVKKLSKEAKREVEKLDSNIVERFKIEITNGLQKILKRAERFKDIILKYSKKRNLRPELVYAITHVESAFNPYAISPAGAYGLMQIVPYTAGREVSSYLFGRPIIFSAEYLFVPENNVNVGTTYLYLLMNEKYFKDVYDPYKRLYCSIASYNAGPGRVAKIFGRGFNSAISNINTLSKEEVFEKIISKAPTETCKYVKKVLSYMEFYREQAYLLL